MPVKVKICGITNLPDALAAVEAGADALGFVFYERSPRYVEVPAAAAIIRQLPPFVIKTGVFVDAPEDTVLQAARECGLNLLQFHGNESPAFCLSFGLMSMKAFRVKGAQTLQELCAYQTDAWLLDACTPGSFGGTGERFDWALAAQAQQLGRPVFLAGGLNPENVRPAIEQARPYGVDVSSGVEVAPGKKDHRKLRAFIKSAKQAAS
jgi:phosphoribosylanthranilate isomerase